MPRCSRPSSSVDCPGVRPLTLRPGAAYGTCLAPESSRLTGTPCRHPTHSNAQHHQPAVPPRHHSSHRVCSGGCSYPLLLSAAQMSVPAEALGKGAAATRSVVPPGGVGGSPLGQSTQGAVGTDCDKFTLLRGKEFGPYSGYSIGCDIRGLEVRIPELLACEAAPRGARARSHACGQGLTLRTDAADWYCGLMLRADVAD